MNYSSTNASVSGTLLKDVQDAPELRRIAASLWQLLDDIDTASDIFKPADQTGYAAFYRYVMRKAELRHKELQSDGYDLFQPK